MSIIALDLHRDFSRALVIDSELKILQDSRIRHGSKDVMRAFFDGFPAGTDVVMEATFNWPWVVELAMEAGLVPHLADCKTARRRSGRTKSDKADALWLARLWFSRELFPHCYVPSRAQLSIRDRYRHRKLLVRVRTQMKNSIHGFLFRCGVNLTGRVSDLFGSRGRALLRCVELRSDQGAMLEAKLAALDAVSDQIAVIDQWIKTYVNSHQECCLLKTIPGIGELTAFGIMAEVGEISRFSGPRALASYAGVLPRLNESADKDLGRHTGYDCNRHLRHLAIETVTGAIIGSARFRSLHSRVSSRNRSAGSKARVAVARAVMEKVWLVLSRREVYMERPLAQAGGSLRVSPASLSA